MDAQITASETAALAALVQSIARLELEEGYHVDPQSDRPEVLEENRFIAARDGMRGRLIDPVAEERVPARELLSRLLDAARPHAEDLGCTNMFDALVMLGEEPGAKRQRRGAREPGRLPGLVQLLADAFSS
jgi:carboxylate-amine ligase